MKYKHLVVTGCIPLYGEVQTRFYADTTAEEARTAFTKELLDAEYGEGVWESAQDDHADACDQGVRIEHVLASDSPFTKV